MRIPLAIIAFVVAIFAVAAGFIYSGIFDVAAVQPQNPLVDWAFRTARNRSINARVSGIEVPSNLGSSEMIEAGAKLYGQRCVVCHGGPGLQKGDIAQGLNPSPPNLFRAGFPVRPNVFFWFIKNGVRMTAMPAFGKTHSDDEIWTLVAFLRTAPGMSPRDFAMKTGRTLPPNAEKPKGG